MRRRPIYGTEVHGVAEDGWSGVVRLAQRSGRIGSRGREVPLGAELEALQRHVGHVRDRNAGIPDRRRSGVRLVCAADVLGDGHGELCGRGDVRHEERQEGLLQWTGGQLRIGRRLTGAHLMETVGVEPTQQFNRPLLLAVLRLPRLTSRYPTRCTYGHLPLTRFSWANVLGEPASNASLMVLIRGANSA